MPRERSRRVLREAEVDSEPLTRQRAERGSDTIVAHPILSTLGTVALTTALAPLPMPSSILTLTEMVDGTPIVPRLVAAADLDL